MAVRKPREADPMTQLRQLSAAVGQGALQRGYVLRGEERYFRDRAEELVRRRAVELEQEVCLHDSEDPDFALTRLTDDLSGGGLFAAQRCVVVRNAGTLLTGETGGKDTGLGRALRAFVESADDVGTLVLSGSSIRADNHVAKAVKQVGGTLFTSRKLYDSPPAWKPDPRQVELVLWFAERAREASVRLTPDQAAYVVAATGNDLFALEAQLERLRGRPASELHALVGWNAEGSPWRVADNLVAGNAARAVSGIEGLFRGGFKQKDGKRLVDAGGLVPMLLSALTGKVRQNLAGARALARGAGVAEAADAAGVKNFANARQEFEVSVRQASPDAWAARLDELAALERRAKGSGAVDATDFALLAVRWRARTGSGAQPSGRGGRRG